MEATQYFDSMCRKYDLKQRQYDLSKEILDMQQLVPSIDVSNMIPTYNSTLLNHLHTILLEHDDANIEDVWWTLDGSK